MAGQTTAPPLWPDRISRARSAYPARTPFRARLDPQRVKEPLVPWLIPKSSQSLRQQDGKGMNPLRDCLQTFWAVIDGVHAGDHRQQHLGGADVAGRLLSANVLLARLKRHSQGRQSLSIL